VGGGWRAGEKEGKGSKPSSNKGKPGNGLARGVWKIKMNVGGNIKKNNGHGDRKKTEGKRERTVELGRKNRQSLTHILLGSPLKKQVSQETTEGVRTLGAQIRRDPANYVTNSSPK